MAIAVRRPGVFTRFTRLKEVAVGLMTLGLALGCPGSSEAANEALLKLLEVLRDRGSISAAEYDMIRTVAEAPVTPAAVALKALGVADWSVMPCPASQLMLTVGPVGCAKLKVKLELPTLVTPRAGLPLTRKSAAPSPARKLTPASSSR